MSAPLFCSVLALTVLAAACTDTPPPPPPTTVPVQSGIAGVYSLTAATAGTVTITQSGTGAAANYTVSVKTSFRLAGATCSLPPSTVVANVSGAGPSFSAANNAFDPTTCAVLGHTGVSVPTVLNADGTITLILNAKDSGNFVLTKTGAVTVVSPTPVGDYSINVSGSVGAVTVVQSGTGAAANYTVSVKTPFKLTGASCVLPAGTVVATLHRAGPSYLRLDGST